LVGLDQPGLIFGLRACVPATGCKGKGEGMETVAVIGAGQMGAGIAQVMAQAGLAVLLADVDLDAATKGRERIGKGLARLVAKEKMTQDEADAALAKITAIGDYAPMAGADLIVEAATEREDIKQKIFAAAGAVLAPHAILASNTSSIPITRMAARTVEPARFIGLHFFNPVPVMKLVEVIPGLATAPATIEAMHALVGRLNKVMVLSQDEAGFIVNRILVPMLNEAVFVLGGGTANVADIDEACRLGLNHPMGPLQLADFIGLDTCLKSCACLPAARAMASIARRRCWPNMSRPGGWAARPGVVSMTTAAKRPFRRGKGHEHQAFARFFGRAGPDFITVRRNRTAPVRTISATHSVCQPSARTWGHSSVERAARASMAKGEESGKTRLAVSIIEPGRASA
jgi:3-hydroxybutyryl-CoA dehydrogenase